MLIAFELCFGMLICFGTLICVGMLVAFEQFLQMYVCSKMLKCKHLRTISVDSDLLVVKIVLKKDILQFGKLVKR